MIAQTGMLGTALGGVAPPATSKPSAHAHRLLESLICDFQGTCLHAATISYLLKASHQRSQELRLGAWRHMLYDTTSIAHLGLRYGADLGLPKEATGAMVAFYERLSVAMAHTSALLKAHGAGTVLASHLLQPLCPLWEDACGQAGLVLNKLEPITRSELSSEYSENSDILATFVAEALSGETGRLSALGEMSLPALAQRRRHPRSRAGQPCRLLHAGRKIAARLIDVSRGGLGLACSAPPPVGSRVTIVLADGRQVSACIVHSDAGVTGVRLDLPLTPDDPLLGA